MYIGQGNKISSWLCTSYRSKMPSACETPRTYSVMWLLWFFNVSNKLEEIQQRSVDCDLVKRGQQQLLHAYVVRAQTQKALVCNWTKHMRKSKHHKYQNVVGQCTFASMLQVHSKWTYSFNSTKWLWFKHTQPCVLSNINKYKVWLMLATCHKTSD